MSSPAERLAAATDRAAGATILQRLAEELERRGVKPEDLGRLQRMSMWQTVTKDADGEAQSHDLYGFRLSPSWAEGPKWPVIQPGPPIRMPAVRKPFAQPGNSVLILPDIQAGYFRHPSGELEPTHDEGAIDVALAVARELRPSRVVLLGDNLDLPEFGRYRLTPAFSETTQATIDAMTTILARLRWAVGPDCTIDWLAGNHEERLQHWLTDNARAAFGLRKGNSPESWPVLSVPYLCRLEEVGVTYHPGYPAADLWLAPDLKIIHGDRVQSKGSTAHKYLAEQRVSVIYGHIHRIERAHRTVAGIDGPVEIMAASPGCLARTDGVVPSTKQGLDLDGRPLRSTEDWQQAVGIVTLHDDGSWGYETAPIRDGVTWWRGRRFEAA